MPVGPFCIIRFGWINYLLACPPENLRLLAKVYVCMCTRACVTVFARARAHARVDKSV